MKLESTGRIIVSKNQLTYLKINDEWIHELFPLLQNHQINKPDYFGEKSVGAHISVIYPEENKAIAHYELDKEHAFKIKNMVKATLGLKNYFVLIVESESLLQLRRTYGLSDILNFRGYAINLHITIGVEKINNA